jgi:hypothetical protein
MRLVALSVPAKMTSKRSEVGSLAATNSEIDCGGTVGDCSIREANWSSSVWVIIVEDRRLVLGVRGRLVDRSA